MTQTTAPKQPKQGVNAPDSDPGSGALAPNNPGGLPEPLAFRIKAVERTTGISRSELYRLLGRGKLDAVKVGRTTLITMESLKRFMAQLPRATFG